MFEFSEKNRPSLRIGLKNSLFSSLPVFFIQKKNPKENKTKSHCKPRQTTTGKNSLQFQETFSRTPRTAPRPSGGEPGPDRCFGCTRSGQLLTENFPTSQ